MKKTLISELKSLPASLVNNRLSPFQLLVTAVVIFGIVLTALAVFAPQSFK